MAVVDFCPPSATATATVGAAEFSCTACAEAFPTSTDMRVHCKTERHLYNTKRKLAGLRPIKLEDWERKLRESRGAAAAEQSKGTSHLKPGKEPKRGAGSSAAPSPESAMGYPARSAPLAPEQQSSPEDGSIAAEEGSMATEQEAWTPNQCLFDRRRFKTVDDSLAYMQKTYSFFIPDREYCTDVPGFLTALYEKISSPPHACLCCNRRFPDLASVRRHMIDKCHTRVGTEARTRRGQIDKEGSEELQDLIDEFYDFHASTREITERMKDPKQKVASLLRYFDTDRDGRLQRSELELMWAAMFDGAELSEETFLGACQSAGVDPDVGFDAHDLFTIYDKGLADLDAHFTKLQDILAKPKPKPEKALEVDDKENDEGEAEEEKDDEEGEGEDEDVEVIECEDEDEFEEVMRVLGLQPVSVLPNGDLRLPNGAVATHRDVQYIYRQRGKRLDQEQLALYGGGLGAAGPRPHAKAQLMLSNAPTGTRIALSKREQVRQGKQIIAIMKQKQKSDAKLGIKRNVLQTQKGLGNRTGLGDHTGGVR